MANMVQAWTSFWVVTVEVVGSRLVFMSEMCGGGGSRGCSVLERGLTLGVRMNFDPALPLPSVFWSV